MVAFVRTLRVLCVVLVLFPLLDPYPVGSLSRSTCLSPDIAAAALTPRSFFHRQWIPSDWRGALWHWTGDRDLKPLRHRHGPALAVCFSLMAFDSLAVLGLPFLAQALYETAAAGRPVVGSLDVMLIVSALLVASEGLYPLRLYGQYRLTKIKAAFVADARVFLLERWLHAPSDSRRLLTGALFHLHTPAFGIRNIELPLKMPLVAVQTVLSAWFLWQRDVVVAGVSLLTALILGLWSNGRRSSLTQAQVDLKQADADAMTTMDDILDDRPADALSLVRHAADQVQRMEVRQAFQSLWYEGVVDRISTIILMTGVMLWGNWQQYLTGQPQTAEIMTLLALAWHVQWRMTGFLSLVKQRLESNSAVFLLRTT